MGRAGTLPFVLENAQPPGEVCLPSGYGAGSLGPCPPQLSFISNVIQWTLNIWDVKLPGIKQMRVQTLIKSLDLDVSNLGVTLIGLWT